MTSGPFQLTDFAGRDRTWLLDRATGRWSWRCGRDRSRGVAGTVWAGLVVPRRVVVGVFAERETVLLQVGRHVRDLAGTAKLEVGHPVPFVRRFRLEDLHGTPLVLKWWAGLADGAPWSGEDILSYVAEQFSAAGAVGRFASNWRKEGSSLIELQFPERGAG